jgi:hypothetical protein
VGRLAALCRLETTRPRTTDSSSFVDQDDVRWVCPAVRDHLRCGVPIGSSGIEIRPYHPPKSLNPGYSRAKRRIYLSATLSWTSTADI